MTEVNWWRAPRGSHSALRGTPRMAANASPERSDPSRANDVEESAPRLAITVANGWKAPLGDYMSIRETRRMAETPQRSDPIPRDLMMWRNRHRGWRERYQMGGKHPSDIICPFMKPRRSDWTPRELMMWRNRPRLVRTVSNRCKAPL